MLFKTPESHHGGDLISFNIWRGRDHGLPGYNFYRERFGLKKVRHFEELLDVFDYEVKIINHSVIFRELMRVASSSSIS